MPQAHVLVVEDDQAVRMVTCEMLQRSGYEVTSACGGEQALEVLAAHAFDVVLLDLRMPGISGREVFVELRQRLPELSVIFMTGYDGNEVADIADQYTSVLAKPFSLQGLLAALEPIEAGLNPS